MSAFNFSMNAADKAIFGASVIYANIDLLMFSRKSWTITLYWQLSTWNVPYIKVVLIKTEVNGVLQTEIV